MGIGMGPAPPGTTFDTSRDRGGCMRGRGGWEITWSWLGTLALAPAVVGRGTNAPSCETWGQGVFSIHIKIARYLQLIKTKYLQSNFLGRIYIFNMLGYRHCTVCRRNSSCLLVTLLGILQFWLGSLTSRLVMSESRLKPRKWDLFEWKNGHLRKKINESSYLQ